MSKNFTRLPEYINEQAGEWFALMRSGDVSSEDQQHVNVWLLEHQDHRKAYEQM